METDFNNSHKYWLYEHNFKTWTMDELLVIYNLINRKDIKNIDFNKKANELLLILALFKEEFSLRDHKDKEDILSMKEILSGRGPKKDKFLDNVVKKIKGFELTQIQGFIKIMEDLAFHHKDFLLYFHNQEKNTDAMESFKEGTIREKFHFYRERNHRLIKAKKISHLQEHNKLACEVCSFDFSEAYGERGKSYVEIHHDVPLSNSNILRETKLEDLTLVCSNCHRMIHRRKPWLSIQELKGEINKHYSAA